MGWASGNDVVEPVIDGLIKAVEQGGMLTTDAEEVLYLLIRSCQNHGWDTEGETLGSYQDLPWVGKAFARAEIYLPCRETSQLWDGHEDQAYIQVECSLPRDHTVDHFDEGENLEWPR